MKLSEMKEILVENGIRLSKSLGQNFLHDNNHICRIVQAAELTPEDQVLEVGPGLGALTEVLMSEPRHVLAIEKDRRLFELLQNRMGTAKTVALVHADALEYLRQQRGDWSNWKLVSNLPYSVASPILIELAEAGGPPQRMVVTVQLEVAQRLVAGPGNANYGVLSLLIQLQYEPRGWFKIPATCFFPVPDVDSACVTLERRREALLDRDQRMGFTKLVKCSFSQRRKMMFKVLKEQWPVEQLTKAFGELQLSPQARAETLSLNQFVLLTKILHPCHHD